MRKPSGPERDGWPVILGIVRRLQELRSSHPWLKGFSDQCLGGVPEDDSLFITYTHERTETPNPRYKEELAAFRERLKTNPMSSTRAAAEAPSDVISSFGENGAYFSIRFDRRAGRAYFPMISVSDFGDSQVSQAWFDAATYEKLAEIRTVVYEVIQQEVDRFEKGSEKS